MCRGPDDDDDVAFKPHRALQAQLNTLIGKTQLIHNTLRKDGGYCVSSIAIALEYTPGASGGIITHVINPTQCNVRETGT